MTVTVGNWMAGTSDEDNVALSVSHSTEIVLLRYNIIVLSELG